MVKKIVLLLSFTMIGCTPKLVHPPMPSPILEANVQLFNKESSICMNHESFKNHRLWLEDVKRYIKEQNEIICYYRGCL